MSAADLDNRDVIDVTTAQGHLDWVRSIIAHRAPEIDAGQIADAYGIIPTEPDPTESVWAEIGEQVLGVLEVMEERLDRIEASVNSATSQNKNEDDDDDDESGDRGQAGARG